MPICSKECAGVLMVEGDEAEKADMLLCEADFPPNYVHMAHPDDFKPLKDPMPVECFQHVGDFGHHRLLLRVSFKMDDGKFVPFTFVVDTGAPWHFYLGDETKNALKNGKRLLEDDIGNTYMQVCGKKCAVHETPQNHKPANILGLKMLQFLGFGLLDFKETKNQETKFGFREEFEYF